jgi:hypothetical protein
MAKALVAERSAAHELVAEFASIAPQGYGDVELS